MPTFDNRGHWHASTPLLAPSTTFCVWRNLISRGIGELFAKNAPKKPLLTYFTEEALVFVYEFVYEFVYVTIQIRSTGELFPKIAPKKPLLMYFMEEKEWPYFKST